MSEHYIDPMLTNIIEIDGQCSADQIFFQRDGASLYYTQPIQQYSNKRLPGQ